MSDTLWQLENVRLGGGTLRFEAQTLCIQTGITAVLGPSGSGKTSLLNMLVGFERPTRGSVTFHGGDDAPGNLPLFWVPQDGGLWPHLTAAEHLEAVSSQSSRDARKQAVRLLSAFDLSDRAAARPDHLSMGQRARLAVARALMTHARVLVMDEPFVHVDTARRQQYWDVIRDQIESNKAALIFSTHEPQTVLSEAPRVVCLDAGRLMYDGDVQSLYWRPQTAQLARCLGEANWLTKQDAAIWLNGDTAARTDEARCFRPQQIQIVPSETSPLVVRSARFRGTDCVVELEHDPTGQARRFVCGPATGSLNPGARVSLRVCLLILLAAFLSACGGSSEPKLPLQHALDWSMPPDGPRVPAPRSIALGRDGQFIVLDTAGRVLIFDGAGTLLKSWSMPDTEVGKPEGVCLLRDGRLAVADTHYHRVVFFDRDGTVLSTFGEHGGGPGQFIYPVKVIQDDHANLYVAEYGGNDRIQKFSPTGQFILSFGGFSTEPGSFQRPSGLLWHDGQIYVADAINHRVQLFHDDGRFVKVLNDSDNPWQLKFPYDLVRGPDGFLYVIEYGAGRVTAITTTGQLVGRFGSAGRGPGQMATPWGLAVDQTGRVLVADTGNRRIVELRP